MQQLTTLLLVVSAQSASFGAGYPPPAAKPVGCYRFDRPLGHSATGDLERGDSSWYRLQLQPAGAVARPWLSSSYWREQYANRSSWRTSGETLFVRVFTGLVGWDLTPRPAAERYAGSARYLSDAIVIGAEPLRVRVQAVREACPPSEPR